MAKSKRGKRRIGIRDRLAQLPYVGALRLLDDDRQEAEKKLRQGGKFDIPIDEVYLAGDTLRVTVPDRRLNRGAAIVTAVEMTSRSQGLFIQCDQCQGKCEHIAATLSLVLEEKMTLGLAAAPDPAEPLENLTDDELLRRAIHEREERAAAEKMLVKSCDQSTPWTDYTVTSRASGKTYRVSIRGFDAGQSYCTCPDFRTNHLGTCKHILQTQNKLRKRFTKKQLAKPYRRKNFSVRVDYGPQLCLRLNVPHRLSDEASRALGKDPERAWTNASEVLQRVRRLERLGHDVHIYPDAEEYIEQQLLGQHLAELAAEIRRSPETHPLRTQLLNTELLPYQLDGIAFAVGAGRAVLADDMGLGKTVQGIGVAELLGQQAGIERVLVVCPASLKSQWRNEVAKFSGRSCQVVMGSAEERVEQYRSGAFFTVANYEQILRDHSSVELANWDLIILDEGQRVKNWESKTTRVINSLRSKFALVLTGTPLENRLEELFCVVGFVDDRRLGPAYRFMHRHRIVDQKGRIQGYKNLAQLRRQLKPILLRRTRDSVLQQLPERTTEVIRIRPTDEQQILSDQHVNRAARIAAQKYLTEMDLLRLQKHLLMARLAANCTSLVDKEEPGYSSKLEQLEGLLRRIADQEGAKVVLFSEWTRMLNKISQLCDQVGLQFVRLDGSVPQKKRQQIVHEFQSDPECRLIMMTNAGSTGLNLQSANTVINVDLPWNPAVLEQRIARAHRMGQTQPVHVYVLVTEDTIEERMLDTLSAKHDLALAALDVSSDVDLVEMKSGITNLKERLERLLGESRATPIDVSEQRRVEAEAQELQRRRQRVAAVSGELLGAAIGLVSELVRGDESPTQESVQQIRDGLDRCTERTSDGKLQLQVTLDSEEQLNRLAASLAKLVVPPSE